MKKPNTLKPNIDVSNHFNTHTQKIGGVMKWLRNLYLKLNDAKAILQLQHGLVVVWWLGVCNLLEIIQFIHYYKVPGDLYFVWNGIIHTLGCIATHSIYLAICARIKLFLHQQNFYFFHFLISVIINVRLTFVAVDLRINVILLMTFIARF